MSFRRILHRVRPLSQVEKACLGGLFAFGFAATLIGGAHGQMSGEKPAPSEAQAAATQALELLQSSVEHWTREVDCFSCHHQGLGGLTLALTKELGLKSDAASIAEEIEQVHSTERARFDALLVSDGVGVFGRSTVLLGLGVRDQPKDSVTDSIASFLAARQTSSGAWYSNEHRPPFEDNHVTASALTMRALVMYGPEGRAAEMQRRVQKGRDWLEGVEPRDDDGRTTALGAPR